MIGHMALPPSSKYLQRPGDPVDETERASITQRLNDAFADGRISHDEYSSSMDIVYDARTLGHLVPVMEKLPAAVENVPAIVEQANLPAGQLSEPRSLIPAAIMVGTVGVVLVAVLVILLALIF